MDPITQAGGEIANNFVLQLGAVAILTISGWAVAWAERKRNTVLQEKYDNLLDRILPHTAELLHAAMELNETAKELQNNSTTKSLDDLKDALAALSKKLP